MMDLVAGVIATAIALKRVFILGLVAGVVFPLVMFLARPLSRWWAARNEVERLLDADRDRLSTYVMIGLAAWFCYTGLGVLFAPAARLEPWRTFLGVLLFLFGFVAIARIPARAARRFARQVVELRASTASR